MSLAARMALSFARTASMPGNIKERRVKPYGTLRRRQHRCAPWGLWIWFKDGRDYETACRFDHAEDAENYARHRLADSDEVEQFALLRRRPGKRDRVKMITRHDPHQP